MCVAFTLMGRGDYRNPVISCVVSQGYWLLLWNNQFHCSEEVLDVCTKVRPYLEKQILRALAQRSSSYRVLRGEGLQAGALSCREVLTLGPPGCGAGVGGWVHQ